MTVVAPIQGTAILVWSAGLEAPERVAALFLTAQACAAMDLSVEMYFAANSVELLQKSEQLTQVGYGLDPKNLGHYVSATATAGIQLWACAQALHHLQLGRHDLVDDCAGLGGVVQFAARCADPAWRTLVF